MIVTAYEIQSTACTLSNTQWLGKMQYGSGKPKHLDMGKKTLLMI